MEPAAMKVLVTGREGQLARSLVERASAFPRLRIETLSRPQLDLEDVDGIEAALGATRPDVIVNAAAYTAVDQAEDEPERAQRINADAAGALAAAARRRGSRFVQISTDYVFDGTSRAPYREDDPVRPLGVYGRTKLAGEERVRAAHPDAAIVRTAWVYSPFGRNFVSTMVKLASEKTEMAVVADQRGSPTAALDLAEGLLTMVDGWSLGGTIGHGQVYHLAGSGEASWHCVAARVFELLAAGGRKVPSLRAIGTSEWPTKAVRPAYSILDSGRFAADFGFVMPDWGASVENSVRRILAGG
jgi:dTDP-4-dehydrorhamnose reductase